MENSACVENTFKSLYFSIFLAGYFGWNPALSELTYIVNDAHLLCMIHMYL